MSTSTSDHGTGARQTRVTVPSPGCLVVLLAPIVAVLTASAVLISMHHRQEQANERNEAEALNRTVALARSYARAVRGVSPYPPGRESVHRIAEQYDGRLTSFERSEGQLATTIRFFGEYKNTSMFGTSYSRAYRCYSVVFREDAASAPQEKMIPLGKCDAL